MGSMTTRAIGYVRVSTDDQVQGYGLTVQRQAIRDYCKASGLRLGEIYSDAGISGSNGLDTREGLAKALTALEAHQAAVFVVPRLDRLARDLILQETILARLQAAGVDVVSVSEGHVVTDDPTRVLIRQVLGAMAQYERALIRARITAGKAAKAAKGGYVGGRPRYGWRAIGGELVEDEHEQAVIARVRREKDAGRSLREIGAGLVADGILPRSGGTWNPNTVRRLLD